MLRRLLLLAGCALLSACGIKGALEKPAEPVPPPALERHFPGAPDVNTPAPPP